MIEPGQSVRVLPPFDEAFPGVYVVADMPFADDSQQIVLLDGVEPAFAPEFLGAAA